jgi:hypothetical protein
LVKTRRAAVANGRMWWAAVDAEFDPESELALMAEPLAELAEEIEEALFVALYMSTDELSTPESDVVELEADALVALIDPSLDKLADASVEVEDGAEEETLPELDRDSGALEFEEEEDVDAEVTSRLPADPEELVEAEEARDSELDESPAEME